MGRREEKKEATRQEILSAAGELFRTKGWDATSVDDIVLAANLAKGTFYYHFQAKEDLVMALQEAELAKANANARQKLAKGQKPLKVLFDFLAEAAHWTETNPDLMRNLFKHKIAQFQQSADKDEGRMLGPPPAFKIHFFNLILELLEQAQKAGEIRSDVPPGELARIVISVVMSARMSWLRDEEGSLTDRINRSIQVLLEGLGAKS